MTTGDESAIDFEADGKVAPEVSDNELKSIATAGQELVDAEAEVKRLTEELKVASERLGLLKRKTVPDLMEAVGLRDFRLVTGERIVVADIIAASLPPKKEKPAERRAAIAWLANEAPDILKSEVSMAFAKGQKEPAQMFLDGAIALADKVAKKFKGIKLAEPKGETDVHYQTLNAWVRDQLKKGRELPTDLFTLFVGKEANIEKE